MIIDLQTLQKKPHHCRHHPNPGFCLIICRRKVQAPWQYETHHKEHAFNIQSDKYELRLTQVRSLPLREKQIYRPERLIRDKWDFCGIKLFERPVFVAHHWGPRIKKVMVRSSVPSSPHKCTRLLLKGSYEKNLYKMGFAISNFDNKNNSLL